MLFRSEQGDLSLVFESVSERRIMMQLAPHLVRPLGFLFPIYTHAPVALTTLRLGLMVYEGLALFRSPKLHKTWSKKRLAKEIPLLETKELRGGPLYYDCMTDDARLTLETLLDAERAGAVVLTYARATKLQHGENGRIEAVSVRDGFGRLADVRVRAGVVLNATGPWSDRVRSLGGKDSHQLRCTKGVHIVLPADRIPLPHTIVCFHPKDQRVLFIIPWADQVYVGTTDTDYEGDPAEVAADRADIDYLLEAVAAYFPTVKFEPHEITSTWAGLRPLIRAEGVAPSQVSREHVITVDDDGLVSIAGGKLTTHRRMGAEVVDATVEVMKRHGHEHPELKVVNTAQLKLPGALDWPAGGVADVARQVAEAGNGRLDEKTCAYLADRYGTRAVALARLAASEQRLSQPLVPGRPEILAQVDWAVTTEHARTVTDVLERRTQLYFRDTHQGLGAVSVVGERMAELLGWSDEERAASERRYQDEVARSRAWRRE